MNIGKIDAERNKQEKNAYAAIIRRHMEFSMEGDETEHEQTLSWPPPA